MEEEDLVIASHFEGSFAYLPPEFKNSKILAAIYCFGIVLLKIASGSRVYAEGREKPNLPQHVLHLKAEMKMFKQNL